MSSAEVNLGSGMSGVREPKLSCETVIDGALRRATDRLSPWPRRFPNGGVSGGGLSNPRASCLRWSRRVMCCRGVRGGDDEFSRCGRLDTNPWLRLRRPTKREGLELAAALPVPPEADAAAGRRPELSDWELRS